MRQLHPGQMTKQNTMAMQGPFRMTGCTRCINHHSRIIGTGFKSTKISRARLQKCFVIAHAAICAIKRQHQFQPVRPHWHLAQFTNTRGIGDQHAHTGILQAIAQGLDSKQGCKRQGNRPHFINSDMAFRDGDGLRQ